MCVCVYVCVPSSLLTACVHPAGLKAAPSSWNSWPVLASLPLLSAAEAEQESERAIRQVVSARQGVCGVCIRIYVYVQYSILCTVYVCVSVSECVCLHTYCIAGCSIVSLCLVFPPCLALASMHKELVEGHVRFQDSGQRRESQTRAADQQYFVKEVSHPHMRVTLITSSSLISTI